MEKLKKKFPQLKICLCADSLYACERFFQECREKGWKYILRFKEGSIPTIAKEYMTLKTRENNYQERRVENGKVWNDHVTDIDYNGYQINLLEYGEYREHKFKKGEKKGEIQEKRKEFWFITDLAVSKKNTEKEVMKGIMRN